MRFIDFIGAVLLLIVVAAIATAIFTSYIIPALITSTAALALVFIIERFIA